MRSRNGNRAFTLAVCALSILTSLAADEYIISYRSVVSDATLTYEALNVSRAMQPCSGDPGSELLLDAERSTDLKQIIYDNFDAFFGLIRNEKLHVIHRETTVNGMNRSRTVMTLPPHCFTVDFNQGLAKISALN